MTPRTIRPSASSRTGATTPATTRRRAPGSGPRNSAGGTRNGKRCSSPYASAFAAADAMSWPDARIAAHDRRGERADDRERRRVAVDRGEDHGDDQERGRDRTRSAVSVLRTRRERREEPDRPRDPEQHRGRDAWPSDQIRVAAADAPGPRSAAT